MIKKLFIEIFIVKIFFIRISKFSIDKDDDNIYGVISYIAPEILQ